MLATDGSTKRCSKCGETKSDPSNTFYRDKSRSDGFGLWCRDCHRAHRAANSERIRAHDAARRATADRQAVAEYHAEYYQKNRDRFAARRAEQYAANREQAIADSMAWKKSHPEAFRSSMARQTARRRGAQTVETVDVVAVWERDSGLCHMCGQPCDPENWHLDHVIPIARGGSHTYENVAVSHPKCNIARGSRLMDETP